MWNFDPDALRQYGVDDHEHWQRATEEGQPGSPVSSWTHSNEQLSDPSTDAGGFMHQLSNLQLWAHSHAGGSMPPAGQSQQPDDLSRSVRHRRISVLRADAPPPGGTDERYTLPEHTTQRVDHNACPPETAEPAATPRRRRGMLASAGRMLGRALRAGRSTTNARGDDMPPSTSHENSRERSGQWQNDTGTEGRFHATEPSEFGGLSGSSVGSWAPSAATQDLPRAQTEFMQVPPRPHDMPSGAHAAELEAQSIYLPAHLSAASPAHAVHLTPAQAVRWHHNRMADLALLRLFNDYAAHLGRGRNGRHSGSSELYRFAVHIAQKDPADSLAVFLDRYATPGLSYLAEEQLAGYFQATDSSGGSSDQSSLREALNLLADCPAEDREIAAAPQSWHNMEIHPRYAKYPLPPADAGLLENATPQHSKVLMRFAFDLLRAGIGGLTEWLAMSNDNRHVQARQLMVDHARRHPAEGKKVTLHFALNALQERVGIPQEGRVGLAGRAHVFVGETHPLPAAPHAPSEAPPNSHPDAAEAALAPATSALILPPMEQLKRLSPEDQRLLSRLLGTCIPNETLSLNQRKQHQRAATQFATSLVERHRSSLGQWLDMYHDGQAPEAKKRLDRYIASVDWKTSRCLPQAMRRLQAVHGTEQPDMIRSRWRGKVTQRYPDGFPAEEARLIDRALNVPSRDESTQEIYRRELTKFSMALQKKRSGRGEQLSLQYVLDLERRGEREAIERLRDEHMARLPPTSSAILKRVLKVLLKTAWQSQPELPVQRDRDESAPPAFAPQDGWHGEDDSSFGLGGHEAYGLPAGEQPDSEAEFYAALAAAPALARPEPAGSDAIFGDLSSLNSAAHYLFGQQQRHEPHPQPAASDSFFNDLSSLNSAAHYQFDLNAPAQAPGQHGSPELQPEPAASDAFFSDLSSLNSAAHWDPYAPGDAPSTHHIAHPNAPADVHDVDNIPSREPAIVSVAQRLTGNAWLRDDDLHNYTRMLGAQLHGQPNAELLQFVDPMQIQSLLTGRRRERDAVLRLLNGPEAAPILFVPVNHNNTHWSLLVIDRMRNQSFHYDSSVPPDDAYYANWTEQFGAATRVTSALGAPAPIGMPMAMQDDAHSCGDHVLTGIDVLAHRVVSGHFFADDGSGMNLSDIEPNRQDIIGVLTNVEAFDAANRNRPDR